ncbi:MAG: PIN domain-containing protein [Pyrinomonadaceae bacterium]|nr:PIN domain-containing protein [Pyrinomonadaceae bacterium]
MRVLLDNDVILDFLLQRQPFYSSANRIFIHLQNKEIQVYISTITPINAFYTTRKEKGKDIAFRAVEGLLKIVEVCRTNKSVLQDAFTLNFSDFEDAVQCASAIAENLDAIVTRNAKDYKLSPIKVFSPDDFLQHLQTI